MKKHLTLATALFFAGSALLFGQNTFTKTYGLPPSYEGLEDLVEADGRYYGLGSKYSDVDGNLDMYLVALSPEGTLIDEFTFKLGDTRSETGQKIIPLSDGLLLLGQITDYLSLQADFLAVKVSFEGELLWTTVYGDPTLVENFSDAAFHSGEGSILLIGERERPSGLLYYVEIDDSGNILTEVETSTDVSGNHQVVIADSNGGWYVGYSYTGNDYILKLDNGLQPQWQTSSFDLGISTTGEINLLLELDNGNLLTAYGSFGTPSIAILAPGGSLAAEALLEPSVSTSIYLADAIQLENGNILLAGRPANNYFSGSEILEVSNEGEPLSQLALNNNLNQLNAIIPKASGFVLAGTSFVDQGGADARVLAISTAFEFQWATTVGAPGRYGEEWGTGLIEGDDNSFYLLGSETLAPGQTDITLTKVNANGNVLWQSSFGAENIDRAYSLTLTADGHIALFGYRFTETGYHIVIYKVSDAGQLAWERIYDPQAPIQAFKGSIVALPDGSVVAGCHTFNREVLLIRISPEGNIEWVRKETPQLGGEVVSLFCYEIALSSDGDLLVGGGTVLSNTNTAYGTVVLKYSSATGDPVWSAFLERENLARAYSLATDEDGAIYGLGWQREGLMFSRILFKLSSTGDSLWFKMADPAEGLDFLANYSLAQAPDNKMFTVSTTREVEPVNSIVGNIFTGLVSLFDGQGSELWRQELAPASYTLLYDGISTSDGGFAVVGLVRYNEQPPDIYLVKMAADGTVSTQAPIRPELQLRLFPNPASEVLQFEINGAAQGTLEAVLYNTQGQPLQAWKCEKTSKILTESLDVRQLPAGAYFLSFTVDGVRYSRQWVKR